VGILVQFPEVLDDSKTLAWFIRYAKMGELKSESDLLFIKVLAIRPEFVQ